MQKVCWLVLLVFCTTVKSSKILCVTPAPGKSHALVVSAVCLELAKRNHQVTYISTFPVNNPPSNFKQILTPEMESRMNRSGMNVFEPMLIPFPLIAPVIFHMAVDSVDYFLSHPAVKEFLNTDESFDLLLMEEFMAEAVIGGFSQKFKAPVVIIRAAMLNLHASFLTSNPFPSSYIVDPLLAFDTRMSFSQRLLNTVYNMFNELFYKCWIIPKHDRVMKKHFGEDLLDLSDVLKNVSLVLINHHYTLTYPRPYLPNMIEIGGMNIPPLRPLPDDLQTFMDNSKQGVIFFSLGSTVTSKSMPSDKRKIFTEAFSKLDQNVLWKFEDDEMPDKPKNVYLSKWVPQTDFLAHPNLKLFITHGGLSSMMETVERGVPVIGIPLFADQETNVLHAEKLGIGKKLALPGMTAEKLHKTILEILENPTYKFNVKKQSAIFKDNPVNPMESAMFWIEYVIRHQGAPHLRSAAQDLNWFQLNLVDVFVVLAVVTCLTLVAVYLVFKVLFRLCRRRVDVNKKTN